ncbi:di-heme oxidoredictase family protein [Lentisalinibacter sediminis]|uniref:di-heme oxidoredictase family protein n=1 Tax=Lentisalinibacter sediminis TaxID=2992237 RepID=UPI00386B9A41
MDTSQEGKGVGAGPVAGALVVALLMSVDVAAGPAAEPVAGPLAERIAAVSAERIGAEHSGYRRLEDGEEHRLPLHELLRRGEAAFTARWTPADGAGRPLSDGTGGPLADATAPLVFPRSFNRVSGRDANSCAGCHNVPAGRPGGGGDFVTGVFVAAQRFDFASFDVDDTVPLKGSRDEAGGFITLQSIGNFRATPGMYGSGYIEMLARRMTAELQTIRDATPPGGALALETKGVSFGVIRRDADGAWDVSAVEGLPPQSVASAGAEDPPSLVIHPFHQSGSAVSIRQFTSNAFNHHHGMQAAERFGDGVDADGDGIADELTRADITAATLFQATLPPPRQVLPRDREARRAARRGGQLFRRIGCADCHVPALPLVDEGWVFTEPNPYNPPGNLQPGDARPVRVDLTRSDLPGRRLQPRDGVVWVPAFTDLKLHDITAGPDAPGGEAIDINQPAGSAAFFAGNRRFLTKRLWGAASEPPYFHHGRYTTLREATLAHDGEARASRQAYEALPERGQDAVIEFLKSLQVVAADEREYRDRHRRSHRRSHHRSHHRASRH